MAIHSKELLMGEVKCTITVVTSPSSATCVLTANGVSYTTKSLEVKKGTVVSYSVSYSGTTTKTGSVTMNSDKTLTFTRTYSTSITYQTFNQPTLDSTTGNGTLGGDSFAVSATAYNETRTPAWKAFDGNTSGTDTYYYCSTATGSYTFYNPIPIKVTRLGYHNFFSTTEGVLLTGEILASNDNTNWTSLKSITNSNTTKNTTWYIDLSNNTNYYKYYKLVCNTRSSGKWIINELFITATKPVTSYTYYFDLTIS